MAVKPDLFRGAVVNELGNCTNCLPRGETWAATDDGVVQYIRDIVAFVQSQSKETQMQTRTIGNYEIAGNKCLAIVTCDDQMNNGQVFATQALLATRFMRLATGNAFVEALCWVDPTLKDAEYTVWGEPFHTLVDVYNDRRCGLTLGTLKRLAATMPLEKAVTYGQ